MPHGHLSVARGEPAVCRVVLLASELRRILLPDSLSTHFGDLELPPIGSAAKCKTGTDARSSGEFSKLPDAKEHDPCPHSHHTSSSPSGSNL
jgi:hypothetical protein